ncbi:MAG: lamin tail domain-containing protein, partial [Planctomycetales bacterium]|nr:lamin tail domain-containing protein [Planctomycetales bacterium]
TVLAAIGEESVQGNVQRVSLLALTETDPAGSGFESIVRIENILDDLYDVNYASVASSVDGGGDSTGFVYDTSAMALIDTAEIAPGALTHSILRGRFRPTGTVGNNDIYIYSTHLKSGATSENVAQRAQEAALIRADADLLGEGTHVLIVGDLNMHTSEEDAYAAFVAPGAGELFDVVDAPGDWSGNVAFKSQHSQDPRTSMDDRFDLQLASGEFLDGVGLEYIDGSYHVFGNNGTHTLGEPITTGAGASPAVLTSLTFASDHLPVVADYEVLVSTPGVRIVPTSGNRAVEGGLFDAYRIQLQTAPTADVVVHAVPDSQLDLGAGPGQAVALTFTPANGTKPQTLPLIAVDDDLLEGNHFGFVTHSVVSDDLDYDAFEAAQVTVSLVDNDAPQIVINELDSDTAGVDGLEFVELYDGGAGASSLDGLTLVFYNGNGDASYAAFDLDGYQTDANGFFLLGNAGIEGVDLTFADNTLQNGADAVALYRADGVDFPSGTHVRLDDLVDAVVYGTDDADDVELLALLGPGQPQLNEDAANSKDLFALARRPDDGVPLQTTSYVDQLPTPKALNDPPVARISVFQNAGRLNTAEGGAADSYQIVLTSFPTANVDIVVSPDSQTDVGAGPGVAITLTFTPADAILPQTVVVTAVDDDLVEGIHTSAIRHSAVSADAAYDGLRVGTIFVTVVDDEPPIIPHLVISELMINPASDESSPGVGEWIEIVNVGDDAIDIGNWLFDDEDAVDWSPIPAGTLIAPGQTAVFFDEEFATASQFRADWSVPDDALVVGIGWGNLANSPSDQNERLQLLTSRGEVIDEVNFESGGFWPTLTNGPSIAVRSVIADNALGPVWQRSAAGVEQATSATGMVYSTGDVGSPGRAPLVGDFNADGATDGGDFLTWQRGLGEETTTPALSRGDANLDLTVDDADSRAWEAYFGSLIEPDLQTLAIAAVHARRATAKRANFASK